MRMAAWYLVGVLAGVEAGDFLPNAFDYNSIFSTLPELITGSIFLIFSFLVFSYSTRYQTIKIIKDPYLTKRQKVIYGIIYAVYIILGWIYLLYQTKTTGNIILLLTAIHLALSINKFRHELQK